MHQSGAPWISERRPAGTASRIRSSPHAERPPSPRAEIGTQSCRKTEFLSGRSCQAAVYVVFYRPPWLLVFVVSPLAGFAPPAHSAAPWPALGADLMRRGRSISSGPTTRPEGSGSSGNPDPRVPFLMSSFAYREMPPGKATLPIRAPHRGRSGGFITARFEASSRIRITSIASSPKASQEPIAVSSTPLERPPRIVTGA